jgi:carbon-monoxide dehydrogenase medium subunit
MWSQYLSVSQLDEVLDVLDQKQGKARIVAGATDLILELERGVRKGIETLIDITRIANLDEITLDEDGNIHLGPLVTHNHCVASKLIRERAFPLAQACWEVGSPQIRNRGTVIGNVITGSPANDTITPLMAMDANVVLRSKTRERVIPLREFYTGVRKTVMQPTEMVVDLFFQAMAPDCKGTYIKFALRQAQAISLVNVAVIITQNEDGLVQKAVITLGAVAPTIIHAAECENFLLGKALTDETIASAAELARTSARPIDDVRGTASYRKVISGVITKRALSRIAEGKERDFLPKSPVLLWGKEDTSPVLRVSSEHNDGSPINTTINGKPYTFESGQGKTLLRLLREEARLIGTKEGCAEGECGACTVFLDGKAVMSCMVPAPRAHGANITTVEGVSTDGALHPVQEAFIRYDAVQCGYCTPGFIMSGAKLLEERPHPTVEEIRQAFTGNLCRCTGYYKIIEAIESASERGG